MCIYLGIFWYIHTQIYIWYCHGLSPAGINTTQLLTPTPVSLPHSGGMGRRLKVKFVCWDKNSLIIEKKLKYGNNGKW